MSKRSRFFFTILACVLVIGLVYAAPTMAEKKKVYKLRMQILFGPDMMWQYQPFIDYCKNASDGRLIIQPFSGGQLVPDDQMMQACATGTIDIAGGAGGYWSDVIPIGATEGVLPFALRTITDVNTFYYQRGYLELCRKAYAEHGVYYLGPQMVDFAYLMAKTPVRNLEDLKKLKLRAVPNIGKVLGKLGVSAQYFPAGEVYLMISSGQLDGVIYGGSVAAESMSFQEVAPYYMTPSFNPANQNLIMSLKKYQSLPKDLQIILDMATQLENLFLQTTNWNLEFAKRRSMMEKNGLQVVEMDTALVDAIAEKAREFYKDVAAKGPYAKQAVEMMEDYMREVGYLK
ncbi:TRAP transporter substrate-binding protein DctP [Desulfotignum balticum]|uniref:TRAP transporter substrate-binding protein DctP n=1 Tax=Desulfotignum balticum TaxID=115781 RepID=UPI00040462F4|nr:TRAP transporter substrate-binding protein DctP [Desulfotignum balticum]